MMKEWTEQEEQQIIELAKAGDPAANFELSQWALQRGEEEPDESRWNRLAAKCLVKSAQAGYEPAKKQMEALLHPEEQPRPSRRSAPAPEPEEEPGEEFEEPEDDPPIVSRRAARQQAEARRTTARRAPASRTVLRKAPDPEPEDSFDEEEDWDDDDEPSGFAGRLLSRFRPAGHAGRQWDETQWRKLEVICVAVCALLLVFIAIMFFTSRRGGSTGNTGSAIPPAGQVAPAENSTTGQAPSNYPDETTKNAIMTADLAIQPEAEDYVTAPTSATVSVSSVSLRLRKGPNTTYDPITEMPNGSVVSVFATKNDWDLVLYEGDTGPIYGWCSSEYLILTSGTAAAPAATDGSVTG